MLFFGTISFPILLPSSTPSSLLGMRHLAAVLDPVVGLGLCRPASFGYAVARSAIVWSLLAVM